MQNDQSCVPFADVKPFKSPRHNEKQTTDLFLTELESTLVFGDLQQLHRSLLIRGKSTHLPNQITYELCVFC